MSSKYPFAALVGQDELKAALLWLAVDPTIGGLLVTGTRGTAKSTAVRALADLLPPIETVANDPFNRAPSAGEAGLSIPTPFVELPVGATEDRVIGTLDVRRLLTEAERRFEPGLLARANRGVLYIDEVNLLPDHLVDVLLDAAATGVNTVERDGASFVHDARIVLVGTMNPEEGELRPQLLDRFGLCVAVTNDDDIERRVEILARRTTFDTDPVRFAAAYAAPSTALRAQLAAARERLPFVAVEHERLREAAVLAVAANAEGMRADLTIVRAARAAAALAGRDAVALEDIELVAEAALAHRRRERPRTPPRPPARPPTEPPPGKDEPRPDQGANDQTATQPERTWDVGAPASVALPAEPTALARVTLDDRAARGRDRRPAAVGRARATSVPGAALAAVPTVRAAGAERRSAADQLEFLPRHLRFWQRFGRPRQLVVFVVDASGSMGAAARMRAAKGIVCGLLEDAYRRRDAVALIAFRGQGASVLLPPTRSAVRAYLRLRELPTGGRTPLAEGLRCAHDLLALAVRRDPALQTSLVVVSDGRANAPAVGAFDAALREAAALRGRTGRSLCIDTEGARLRLGGIPRLANVLGAACRHLDDCSERALGATVREWMASA